MNASARRYPLVHENYHPTENEKENTREGEGDFVNAGSSERVRVMICNPASTRIAATLRFNR
jgi:hypothetical protein